eukprot:Opistho-2@38620
MFSSIRSAASLLRTGFRWVHTAPEGLSQGEKHLFDKLNVAFTPSHLLVEDISGGCGSMYRVEVESANFTGLSLVKQYRLVHDVLDEDIKKMHGIRIATKAPTAE